MSARALVRAEAARLRGSADQDWEAASPERRDAMDDAIVMLRRSIAGPYVQTGPTPAITARWILGASPRSLAPALTRAEASEWIRQSEHATPREWLWSQIVAREVALAYTNAPSTIAVVRWVDSVMRSPEQRAAFMRPRTARLGDDVEGSILDRLDEIAPEDLRDGPGATIDAAVERAVRNAWSGPDELAPAQDWHASLPDGITVLRTFRSLHTEGRECRHCVASYASAVASRAVTIVQVLAPDGTRSTASISNARVAQHKGPRNEPPSMACQRLLAEVVRWI